jgi:hypothetical protein
MPNEGFFQRWSRLKREGAPATPPVMAPPEQAGALPAAAAPAPLPTLEDVAALGADADYARFVAPGVETGVRRLALKKLFADPHFKLIDGLDIYMADYNLPDPVSPAMLASLQHAQDFLARALAPDQAQQPGAGQAASAPPNQDKA